MPSLTFPTRFHWVPMMKSYEQSSQGSSEKSRSSHSKQLLYHVLKNVLKINTDDRVSFPKWMKYMYYHNISELSDDLQFELKHIHDYSDYIVNGQNCALKFGSMSKMKLLISWMSTRKKETTFQLSSQYLLSLTSQDFNKFRQENMIRMTKVTTSPTPSTAKPFPSHTSRSKTRPVFLSRYVDLFDEPKTLLDKDESDPSPSPTMKSPSNFLGTKKTLTRVHFKFPMDSKKLII